MRLYHGSIEKIEHPRILEQQRLLDFGKGFYSTSNKEQAERWASIKQKRAAESNKAIVTVYEFDDDLLQTDTLKIKSFTQANEEWLDFVVRNRSFEAVIKYDLVIGPVANDTLYITLSLYEAGFLTKNETIVRLKVHPRFDQLAFITAKAIEHLKYIRSYDL
jgi:hypothetical protein